MENARVITLGPSQQISSVSFEEAFGEHSEFRGKGRKRKDKRKSRRQERKLKRIRNRDERKSERKRLRAERKRRQLEARLEKKMMKRKARLERKSLGDEPEENMDEQTAVETGSASSEQEQPQAQDSGSSDSGSGDSGSSDSGSGDSGSSDSGSGDSGSSDSGSSSQESGGGGYSGDSSSGSSDSGSEEEESEEESEEEESEEEGEEEGEGDEGDSGVDGVVATEDTFGEMTKKVNPKVREITRKIEWNSMLIDKLNRDKANLSMQGRPSGQIDANILRTKKRMSELADILKGYSSADGGRHRKRRNAEIKRGFALAKFERKQRMGRKSNGGCETPVDSELKPELSTQRIVIPAEQKSNASANENGTQIDPNDYDAPQPTTIEISSSAEGKKSSISLKHVAIGVGIAVAGIWAYNKYFKKK